MVYEILSKKKLAENTFQMVIKAPEVAAKAQPGQFVILRLKEKGERIPLTIADYGKKDITIIFQSVGKSTKDLSKMRKGDKILDFVGPLGHPSNIEKHGTVVLVGGGLGIAPIYPIARALRRLNNQVICIIGARSKKHLFWIDEIESACNRMIICTDDGSKGRKGFVTDALNDFIIDNQVNLVYAIGPPVMMKFVCKVTKARVKTIVSLNSIMVDGIGMCGGCRVVVDDVNKFACCDGPEFDGHKVHWNKMLNRMNVYAKEENCACEQKKLK